MHSRSYLLLKRELANFERVPLQGISAAPVSNDDMYKWSARLEGPEDTIWKGAVFRLNIIFTDEYNAVPPIVNFMTIPFHPNVHPDTGEPFCNLLTNHVWNENYDLQLLLQELQRLLTNPEDSDPSLIKNEDAAHMYKHKPHTYKQMVLDCVTASLRIEAGVSPYSTVTISRSHSEPLFTGSLTFLPPIPSTVTRRKKQISFDDYHKFWKGQATSVPGSKSTKSIPGTERHHQHSAPTTLKLFDPNKRTTKSEQSERDDIESRMTNHLTLKYGISREPRHKKDSKTVMDKEYRQKRIAQLMELYTTNKDEATSDDDIPPGEADELVKWTKTLNMKDLTIAK